MSSAGRRPIQVGFKFLGGDDCRHFYARTNEAVWVDPSDSEFHTISYPRLRPQNPILDVIMKSMDESGHAGLITTLFVDHAHAIIFKYTTFTEDELREIVLGALRTNGYDPSVKDVDEIEFV